MVSHVGKSLTECSQGRETSQAAVHLNGGQELGRLQGVGEVGQMMQKQRKSNGRVAVKRLHSVEGHLRSFTPVSA